MNHFDQTKKIAKQEGAALITALVLLVLMTLLALSTMTTSSLEERMASNTQETIRAFQAASTGLELVFNDEAAFDTTLTAAADGTADDRFDKTDATIGGSATGYYNATSTYNSIFRESTSPPRGSGWDSTYSYYHFDLTAEGSTDSGAAASLHAGAYQVGKAP